MAEKPFITILLVDDDDAKRDAIAKILRDAEYQVREAASGREALRAVADRPDLIVLDVELPDLSGFEVCRRIKTDPATADIPVLHMSTTFIDVHDKLHGLEEGADGYLTEVPEPLELTAIVKALLRARSAEEAAQLSLERWRATFASINDGVLLLDADGRIVQANEAAERLLPPPPSCGGLVGREFHDVLEIVADPGESPLLRMLRTQARESIELERSGRWLRVDVDPMRDRGSLGAENGAVGIITDVTDGRRLRETLRTRADELAVADARKNEFLAMLAHELRNPLAPILNSMEIIRLLGPVEPGVEQALAVAERQVRHMARLIEDLLDVSRLTKGKIQLQLSPVDLRLVVEHAVESARPRIAAQDQQLTVNVPKRSIRLQGDSTRLQQVIGNLLNNAAKYSDRGGKIRLDLKTEGREAVIRIRDDGIGLAPEALARVFDLFTQMESTLDRAQGGLGIGLTLVKSLVELHGGSVLAESPGLGRGCVFTVRLPLAENAGPLPREGEHEGSAEPIAAATTGRRVLIVDDHEDSAATLAAILKSWGHRAAVAHDGPRALELVKTSGPFDVVLLDLGLPGMDGYQVAERIRLGSAAPAPVITALTGFSQEDDVRRSREAGFDDHLVKPVDLDRLQRILDDLDPASGVA